MAKVIIFFGVIILIGLFMLLYSHEKVHQQIFKSYGINSTIHFFAFPASFTRPEKNCPENTNCELAHDINEVVGYQFLPIYLIISVGFLIIISQLERMNELKAIKLEVKNG